MTRQAIKAAMLAACLALCGCSSTANVRSETIDTSDSASLWATLYESDRGTIWDGHRGFESPEELRTAIRKELAIRGDTDEADLEKLAEGWIWPGMSRYEAAIAMAGEAHDKTKGGSAAGTWEAWHYYRRTLYFRGDRLSSWIEHDPY